MFRTVPISVTTADVAMRITVCLSLVNLTALSTSQTIQRLMMSLVVNDELGGMCKESVVIQLHVLCGHLLRLVNITRLANTWPG